MRSYSLIPPISLNSSSNDFSIELKRTHSVKRKNSLKPINEEDEKQNLSTYKTSINTQSPFQTTNEDKSHYKNRTFHINKKSSLISERKTIVEQSESSGETSSNDNFSNSGFSNSDSDYLKNKKKKKKKVKNDYRNNKDMYIIASIDSLYSKQKITNKLLKIHYIYIKYLVLLSGMYFWILLFQTSRKFERNYCFDKNLNQFNSCSQNQVCKKFDERINIFLYNDSSFSSNFTYEIININDQIKTFFSKYFYQLSIKKVFGKLQINIDDSERENFVVILNKREKWNFIYRYYSICKYPNYHYVIIISYTLGGILGGFLLGFLCDILGRRKVIIFCLTSITIISLIFIVFFQLLNYDEKKFNIEFHNNFNIIDFEGKPYLHYIYVQDKMRFRLERTFFILQVLFFLVGFFTIPLKNCSVSLITENSYNTSNLMKNFRDTHFSFTGISPFVTYCIVVLINDLTITFIIVSIFSLILTIISFFFLDESMRHLYEFCDWKALSYTCKRLLHDLDDKDYCNINSLKEKENSEEKYIYRMFNIKRDSFAKKKKVNFYTDLKNRTEIFKTNIRRNIDIIIRKKEIMKYPYLIFTCIRSNRMLQNSKITLIQTLIIVFLIDNLLRAECFTISFFGKKELFFGKNFNNYIINSNFFIYFLILLASNQIYFCLFRLISFKGTIVFSLVLISFFSILHHILTYSADTSSMNLNRYNYGMYLLYQEEVNNTKYVPLIFLTHFFMNGISFLMQLVILKYTRTLYRGTLMGLFEVTKVLTFLLSTLIKEEMEYSMLFTGIMNLIGIFTIFFLDELKEQPYIINDMKKKYYSEEEEKPKIP